MASTTRAPVRGVEMPRHIQVLRRGTPRPLQLAVRSAVRSYGAHTSGSRPLPDYLIIGAKKGGTSSLANWLIQHPDHLRMFPSFQPLKSPHFFDINFHRGVDWYRGHFPSNKVRSGRQSTVVGEASPYYMFHPAAARRAFSVVPQAKIIAVLRNPVSRAYSNYWDRVSAGTETIPTFERALNEEPRRMETVDFHRLETDPSYYSFEHDQFTYRARGRYLEHLSTWLDLYPADQVMIVNAEEMYADPGSIFADVQRFLGLPVCASINLRVYNERGKPPIDPQTKRDLGEYYRPFNAQLYERLGRDMGWDDSCQ